MSTNATVLAVQTEARRLRTPQALLPGSAVVRDFVPPAAPPGKGAAIERELFDRGIAEGRRRALESFQADADAHVGRLAAAIDAVAALRTDLVRRSERDVVTLALEMARRIVKREVTIDPGVLLALSRDAVARLSGTGVVNVEMHPDLFRQVSDAVTVEDGPIQLVENPHLAPGACIVRSSAGAVQITLDAQIEELLDTLLAGSGDPAPMPREDDGAR